MTISEHERARRLSELWRSTRAVATKQEALARLNVHLRERHGKHIAVPRREAVVEDVSAFEYATL